MRIAIGSDHRGFPHKELLKDFLEGRGHQLTDCGCDSPESADYPDSAFCVAEAVAARRADLGILICGSGIGMSIAANKVAGVRASLCFTPEQAATTRRHNDSNVLCLSGDGLTPEEIPPIATAYLESSFEGGRHACRVDKITAYENRHRA
ncbi:ribose 5-phosphate isomerase B [bacterium CG_4_9_14_3_um_filter_65_15]|nr:MAG: ribose 5-phosphate isomerase B [bacterium CG_4_9_14_3_um_filter_65_15]